MHCVSKYKRVLINRNTGESVRTFGFKSNKVVLRRDNLNAFPDCFLLVYIVGAFKGQLSLHSEKRVPFSPPVLFSLCTPVLCCVPAKRAKCANLCFFLSFLFRLITKFIRIYQIEINDLTYFTERAVISKFNFKINFVFIVMSFFFYNNYSLII